MTDVLPATPEGIARAAALLRGGGLVAFPTDTVYGVACAWAREDRVSALFELKHRPPEKRIAALVADLAGATSLGFRADDRALALSARYWPGSLTIVLPAVDPGGETRGFRAPDHPVALDLIRAAGPLLATSANVSGEPDALEADDVLIAFATQQDALDAVVDGGRVPGGVASTVVDLSVTPARLVRDGPVTRATLSEVVELEG
jgi:L-threonylcarbamoyladenylate synthase